MVTGAPLENARHLAQRYDKLRQETEAQVTSIKPPWRSAASVINFNDFDLFETFTVYVRRLFSYCK